MYSCTPVFNFGAKWGAWLSPRPGRFYPRQRDLVPNVQEAGWAPGPVWTSAENLAPTGIRSPGRPACTVVLVTVVVVIVVVVVVVFP